MPIEPRWTHQEMVKLGYCTVDDIWRRREQLQDERNQRLANSWALRFRLRDYQSFSCGQPAR